MSKERQTLLGLLVGNVLYAALISLIGSFFVQDALRFALGAFWSCLGACIVTVHLYLSLQKSLELGEDGAMKRESNQAVVRMLIMIVVVSGGLLQTRWFDPLGVVLGAFSLKVSAYIQPFFIR